MDFNNKKLDAVSNIVIATGGALITLAIMILKEIGPKKKRRKKQH